MNIITKKQNALTGYGVTGVQVTLPLANAQNLATTLAKTEDVLFAINELKANPLDKVDELLDIVRRIKAPLVFICNGVTSPEAPDLWESSRPEPAPKEFTRERPSEMMEA